ncbi:hypothetical protein [Mesorhizobium australicum]|uniref:Uncharacterized protein n=1 Tax=Mesorhizobium australicum TaxID=536018 RepID=A0A1X7NXL8_9HYPH|nr:hypothetical protein [Mesorhizobium australicum]SMH43160.1 hypothetical protein SAMN02982922_2846 [Mesorhizobium australicum]
MRRARAARPLIALAAGATLLAALPGAGLAAVIGSCTIMVQSSGTMKVAPLLTSMSSRNSGGSAAQVSVNPQSLICNILALLDCYSISTPAPASFLTWPSGWSGSASFASAFTINGGVERPGNTPVMVANGTKTLNIHLDATGSGIFRAGAYQAQVTVRCE